MKNIDKKYSYKTTEKEGVITIVIIENDKKVVYVDTTYHPEGVETIIKNFMTSPNFHKKMFNEKLKKVMKNKEGNYKRTKIGKELYQIAETILAKANLEGEIKIEKSDVSNSKYIEITTNDETYTIRISDHLRKDFEVNGIYRSHDYDYQYIGDYKDLDKEKLIEEVSQDLRNKIIY